jgi:hypothetical protein
MPKKKPENLAQEDWDAVEFPEERLRQMKPLRDKPGLLRALKRAQAALRDEKALAK